MPYRMCKASAILALRVACKVHDFAHDHIQKDKYVFGSVSTPSLSMETNVLMDFSRRVTS